MPTRLLPWIGVAGLLALSGCAFVNLVAVAAGKPPIKAAYSGLKAQRVGIMVWVDHAASIDFPSVQPDLARGLQGKIKQAAAAKADEVQNIEWVDAGIILRFQEAHPELEAESAADLARRLDVTRLIYIEVGDLSLHPNESVDLARGAIDVDLKVIEVANGQTSVGYSESNISAIYPLKAPLEGLPGLSDSDVYHHTIDTVTSELAKRFITHEADTE
jgi:hypothetical protein